MRIYPGLFSAAGKLGGGAVALGNFDGVHLGHRALFADAARHGGTCAALTFEPHPVQILAPRLAPPLIASPRRKRELMAGAGVQALVIQRFDRDFARTEPARFVQMLVDLAVGEVVVGYDYTYGRDRAGNVAGLRVALEERGVRLHVVPPVTAEGLVVSSTKVRELSLEGRMEAVARLLGRPLDLDGTVVRGAGRGKKLGWPTANLQLEAGQLLPAIGVYAVRARLVEGGSTPDDGDFLPPNLSPPLPAAANLGLNPTFRDTGVLVAGQKPPLLLEVHLIDFAGDLYGKTLRAEFVEKLRDERRFPNVQSLKEQIARDVEQARRVLAGP